MFTITNVNPMLIAIRDNRAVKNPVVLDRKNPVHANYRDAVESLRVASSRLAASAVQSHDSARIAEFSAAVASAFRRVLNLLGEPNYSPTSADVDAVIAIVGNFRTVDGRKQFVPAAEKTFRNYFEKFIGIRANAEIVKDAETIKADKRAARKARKEAKKAAALASGAPALPAGDVIESTAVEIA